MFDAFIKLGDDISGESQDDKHQEWVEVLSYSHAISQPITGAGGSAERCDHSDFSIVKRLDKSSPKLMLLASNGQRIPEVTMELCRAAGDKQRYLEIKFSDVLISSVCPQGTSSGEEALPLETVTLNYMRLQETYTELDPATGSPKGDVQTHWDLRTNTGG